MTCISASPGTPAWSMWKTRPYYGNLTVTVLEQVLVPASHTIYVNLARPVTPVESVYLPMLGTVAITVPLR